MYSWQQEVLDSKSRWTIARVCRRAGKTYTAIQWAMRKPNERVLFVVPYVSQVKSTFEYILDQDNENPGLVLKYNRTQGMEYIVLANGTTIDIVSANALRGPRMCGKKVTRIVVDEAGHIGGDIYEMVSGLAAERLTTQVLLISSTYEKDSLMDKVASYRPSSALYVSYDYVDMLRDKKITPKTVFDLQNQFSLKAFAQEFGPYNTFDIDNQTMEHVLRALDEY